MKLAVSTPYVVVLTTRKSVSDPFQQLYDTLLALKMSVIKSGFNFDFALKISAISSCRFLS